MVSLFTKKKEQSLPITAAMFLNVSSAETLLPDELCGFSEDERDTNRMAKALSSKYIMNGRSNVTIRLLAGKKRQTATSNKWSGRGLDSIQLTTIDYAWSQKSIK